MLNENTPIEEYQVKGHTVYVKRDDLFGQYPAPPLAKLRGARVLLKKLKDSGVRKVAVFDTRISKAGQGVAYLCRELELECLVGFPLLKEATDIAETHKIARQLGATLASIQPGRTAICYAVFKREAEQRGYHTLPLGLVCQETVETVKNEALRYKSTPMKNVACSFAPPPCSIVLCTGTGTIATGVALGFAGIKVYGVSCGMDIRKQWKRIHQLAYPNFVSNLILIPPKYDYYTALDTSSCPFPTSPYYDMKAWEWLVDNIDELEEPTLFWNIGI